jgi:hypothetical protein
MILTNLTEGGLVLAHCSGATLILFTCPNHRVPSAAPTSNKVFPSGATDTEFQLPGSGKGVHTESCVTRYKMLGVLVDMDDPRTSTSPDGRTARSTKVRPVGVFIVVVAVSNRNVPPVFFCTVFLARDPVLVMVYIWKAVPPAPTAPASSFLVERLGKGCEDPIRKRENCLLLTTHIFTDHRVILFLIFCFP